MKNDNKMIIIDNLLEEAQKRALAGYPNLAQIMQLIMETVSELLVHPTSSLPKPQPPKEEPIEEPVKEPVKEPDDGVLYSD